MKNLVFNLRTAKAQAGCAKVTKSSRMAKILTTLTLLLTLGVGQMWAGTRTIYFDTNGYTFKESATNFAVYLWNDQGNEWVTMNLVSGTIYSASIPDSRTKCVFCAVDSYGATGWNHRKAQTDDQKLSAYNLYTVTSSNKGNGDIRGSWSTYSATFSVTYNGNGKTSGSVPSDATSYSSGGTVTVSGKNTLAKTGYTFAGWNTAADGSGTYYAPGATFSITANTTLYAIWYDNKVLGGTNVMFYVESYKTPIHLTNGSAATNLAVTTISSPVGYINIAKTNLSTYYYITDNQSGGWAGDQNNGIKSAKGGEKFVKNGSSNVAAKTASTTASVTGDVLNLSTTCNSATGVYNSKSLYILYYLNSELIGVSYNSTPTIFVPAATTARASTYNVSGLSNGSYTLKTILTDGLVYYIADSDEFTVSHATNTLTVSAGTGISAVTGTTNNITAGQHIVITATVATGYEWSTWTKTGDGTLSTFTAGTKNQTVTVGTAGNMTLTASATERMSSLSTSCSYSSGSPGYAAPTVSGSATTVGYVTMRTITATTPGAAYTLSSWTITNGTRTDGGAANASSITIRSNGNGSAVTVTANYTVKTKVRLYYTNPGNFSTPKAYFWDNSNTSDNNGWAGDAMTSTTECGDTYYYVEYYKEDHPNWNRVIFNDNGNSSTQTSDITFSNTTNNGQYNNAPASRGGTGSWSATPPARWAVAGSWDSYSTSSNLMTCDDGTLYTEITTFTANTDYQFKLYDTYTSTWYGVTTATKITYENKATAQTMSNTTGGCPNQTIKTAAAGTYRFIWDPSNKKVTVNYPTSYKVELEVGTVKGNARTPKIYLGSTSSESNVISSGSYVAAGSKVIFWIANDAGSAPAAGYNWWGFYDNATGANPTKYTNNTVSLHTINSIAADAHVYAVFGENDYWITPYINGQGSISPNGANAHIATPTEFTANPGTGYMFDSWEERGGSAMTIESPSVATTNVTTTAAATLQANFSPRWSVIGTGAFGGWSAYNTNLFTGYTVVSTKDVGYKSITLAANTSYEIKVYDRLTSTTYGGSAVQTIDYAHSGAVNEYTVATTASPKSVTIQSAAGGTYTLNWNLTDKKIAVVYPTSWYITTGQKTTGQDDNAGGSFTAVDNASNNVYGGKFVADNATVTFTATPNTGYNFVGWYSDASCETAYVNGTGGAAISGEGGVVLTLSSITAAKTVYAKFTPKTYTITLTRTGTGYGSGGDATLTATYGAAFPAATMPTAAEGYAFMGYYSEANGAGTQFTNASGVLLANITDYSDESGNWKYDGTKTLYAYYKKAEITELALDAAVVQPNATVGVTPTIEPTPTPSTRICWKVLHGNGNPLDAQPAFTWNGTKLTFAAFPTSGTYLIQAVLRTGSVCGSGTVLDSVTAPFQVAGDHVVTVQYKCGDEFIKASTTATGRPLDWTGITAPDIVGYSFSKWQAGDGITINGADGSGEKASADIEFKAIYDGKLTAVYNKKKMVYFYNTVGWDTVFVYFYNYANNNKYWDNNFGTGAHKEQEFNGNKPFYQMNYSGMKRVAPGSNIWFCDYTSDIEGLNENDISSKIAFAKKDQACTTSSGNQDAYFYNTEAIFREDFNPTDLPMFVPLTSPTTMRNSGTTKYYDQGYWMNYPNNTGYTLKIYDDPYANKSTGAIREYPFPFSADKTLPLKLDVEFNEGGAHLWFMVYRNDGKLYGRNYTLHQNHHPDLKIIGDDNNKPELMISAPGVYTFTLSYHYDGSSYYDYYINIDYPIAVNDYRIDYSDNATWSNSAHAAGWHHPSDVIRKNTDAEVTKYDTVSFFISKDNSPAMKFQYVSNIASDIGTHNSTVTWSDGLDDAHTSSSDYTIDLSDFSSVISSAGVYNFIVKQVGTAAPVVEKAEPYTGNYYIRTDCANSKWDNYDTDPDHLITYSEYSITNGGYSHYYCHWVKHTDTGRKNVKFVIANDYSPCISDTLTQEDSTDPAWTSIGSFITAGGDLLRDANVRFMWNQSTNKISRAYVDGAQGDDSNNFLKMLSADGKITDLSGEALTEVKFQDNENWIYEANIQAQPNAEFKLISNWGTGPVITQYFKGTSSSYETLITGSGTSFYTIRVLYDFKTNRLIAALLPSGDIVNPMPINADVMFIREHQGDINQVILTEGGTITNIKTAYGVVRFNKWTINNKSKEGGHDPLTTPASIYERSLYWVSFPFRVKLSEVFGFGTYGTHWIIQYYDGAARAQKGMWAETGTYWKFVWDRRDFFLEPNTGYLLTVETDLMGEESGIWGPESRSEQVELFFPSYGTMPNITQADVTINLEAHTCTIDRTGEGLPGGNDYRTTYDRRIVDSHWNVMGVPTYINTDDVTFPSNTWTTTSRPNFLYTWNMDDNTITATSASKFTFHAMHAYMVQCYGDVTWSAHSGSPYPIVARSTYSEAPKAAEFCLELQQNEKMIDRTFIKLSDDEDVSEGFAFNEDMTKEFSGNKSAIYTFIAGDVVAAGNTLPMTDQKTIVPVGVETKAAGTYTISIPAGTAGIGVTLIDEETGVRTNLSALDYTVDLSAGKHDSRFWIEISPVKGAETGIDPGVDARENSIRKVMIDGILYIVRDGKMYDARGARVE